MENDIPKYRERNHFLGRVQFNLLNKSLLQETKRIIVSTRLSCIILIRSTMRAMGTGVIKIKTHILRENR